MMMRREMRIKIIKIISHKQFIIQTFLRDFIKINKGMN